MTANHFSLGDQGKLLWGGDYNIHAFYFLCFLMVWHLGTLQILERLPLLRWTNSWRQQILLIYRPTNPESISSSFPFIRLLQSRTLSLCPKAPKTKWFLTVPILPVKMTTKVWTHTSPYPSALWLTLVLPLCAMPPVSKDLWI